ncbi:hypothetical protein C8R46DRAFT_1032733 [Mycena filopes]|nr:hypothetical protein C8R46DRAFT_1032733 [Mycena filopes]
MSQRSRSHSIDSLAGSVSDAGSDVDMPVPDDQLEPPAAAPPAPTYFPTAKFSDTFMTVHEGHVYQFLTRQDLRPLDPFQPFRDASLQNFVKLMLDSTRLERYFTSPEPSHRKIPIKVFRKVYADLMEHYKSWADRSHPKYLDRFLYPVRIFYKYFTEREHEEFAEGKSTLVGPQNLEYEANPLPYDWKFPVPSFYWVPMGLADPELIESIEGDGSQESDSSDDEDPRPPPSSASAMTSRRSETSHRVSVPAASEAGPSRNPGAASHRTPSTTSNPTPFKPTPPVFKTPSTTSRPDASGKASGKAPVPAPKPNPAKSQSSTPAPRKVQKAVDPPSSSQAMPPPAPPPTRPNKSHTNPAAAASLVPPETHPSGTRSRKHHNASPGPSKTKNEEILTSSDSESQKSEVEVETKSTRRKKREFPNAPPAIQAPPAEDEKPEVLPTRFSFRKLFANHFPDFPSFSEEPIAKIAKEHLWMFDQRAMTLNLWQKGTPTVPGVPPGRPWPPKNPTLTTNGLPLPENRPKGNLAAAQMPHHIPTQMPFPKISANRIHLAMLRLIEDPGFSCLECVLFDTYCEFRGYNHKCTACDSQKRRSCSFTATDDQLERFRLESYAWIEMGHLPNGPSEGSWNLVQDVHIAFIRAHAAHRAAVLDTLDFQRVFHSFLEHANFVIEHVGVEQFNSRFTRTNSTATFRDRLAEISLAQDPHIEEFDPSKSAHGGKDFSGEEFDVPTVKEQMEHQQAKDSRRRERGRDTRSEFERLRDELEKPLPEESPEAPPPPVSNTTPSSARVRRESAKAGSSRSKKPADDSEMPPATGFQKTFNTSLVEVPFKSTELRIIAQVQILHYPRFSRFMLPEALGPSGRLFLVNFVNHPARAGNVKNAASTALLELGGAPVSPVNASWTTPASLWIPRPGTLSTTTTIPNGLVVPSSVATAFLSPSSKSTFPQSFAGFAELTSTAPAVTFAKLSKVFTVVLNSWRLSCSSVRNSTARR